MLPLTCAELLPDYTPFNNFLAAVARSQVTKDRRFSKRVYRLLSLRERIADLGERGRESNPVDVLVKKTLCFFREQREPLKPVSNDDDEFMKFLRLGLKDLESKVDEAVYDWEFERQERREFERRAMKNQKIVDSIMREADVEADSTFDKLARRAKRKAQGQ